MICRSRSGLENLKVFVAAANQRNEEKLIIRFSWPPGLGGTLANILANELEVGIKLLLVLF
jgi:Holliday junction DNA helicase RuvB